MSLVLVTGPAVEPLELDALKAWMKVEVADDDAIIQGLITAVRVEVEDRGGIALVTQTWDQVLEEFPRPTHGNPGAWIELGRRPVTAIVSVSYVDSAGQTQVLGASNYALNAAHKPPLLLPAYGIPWPAERGMPGGANVTVRFTCGYGADETAIEPRAADLLQAMRAAVTELRIRREMRVAGTIIEDLPILRDAIDRHQLFPMGLR